MAELVYIIPPYLLNTCLGSELQQELCLQHHELGTLNVVSTDSPYFQSKTTPTRKVPFVFLNDIHLNEIVKTKVRYKLAILGVLGNSPMELIDDAHLFELFTIFKSRLINEVEPTETDSKGDAEVALFTSKAGEISLTAPDIPASHSKYLDYQLKDLLRLIRSQERAYSSIPPSFIKLENLMFQYPLPLSWTPFFENKYLKYFQEKLNLDLNNDSGYTNINMNVDLKGTADDDSPEESPEIDLARKHFNFIADKPIESHTGVYYYEVEVEQEVTESTSFKPLIVMNDSFISDDRSLNLSIGFIKKFIDASKLDLETIRSDVLDDHLDHDLNLNLKPGEFKGSFAISYEDSSFYSSLRNLEQRVTNLNRRFPRSHIDGIPGGSGRTDLGLPFKTKLAKDEPTRKIYKTDPIGCGINFIDKSIFITLNGVLVKVIKLDELAGTNMSTDSLFTPGSDCSVYPMLGFKINDAAVEAIDNSHDVKSKLNVKTNFGFKEFHFDINNYIKNFKDDNEKKILNLASHSPTNSSKSLNKLIKDYLNHEGYLDTFESFNSDLHSLQKEVDSTYDLSQQKQDLEIEKSTLSGLHSVDRNIIKQYLRNNLFDPLFTFLKINYPVVLALHEFKLKLLKFTYLLKQYVSEFKKEDYDIAVAYRTELQESFDESHTTELAKINLLAAVLFVKDDIGLHNLLLASLELQNYSKSVLKVSSDFNSAILKGLGFKKKSNLQQIFEGVDSNMKLLGLKAKDEKFMLVNFEKDHMDL